MEQTSVNKIINGKVFFYGEGDSYINAFNNIVDLLDINIKEITFLSDMEEILALRGGTLFLGLGGVKLNQVISKCKREGITIVSYFPGIIHLDVLLSVFSRASSDIVILPNKYAYNIFRKVQAKLSFNCSSFVLPYLLGTKEQISASSEYSGISLFIEQSIVPTSEKERKDFILTLFDFAKRYPSRKLIILVRDHVNSPHTVTHSILSIIDKFSLDTPKNVNIVCGRSSDYIDQCDHVISFTSTVILEAVHKDKAISILTLKEPYVYGQDLFFGTGLVAGKIRTTDKVDRKSKWFKDHVIDGETFLSFTDGNKINYDFTLSLVLFVNLLVCNISLHSRLDRVLIRSIMRSFKYTLKYNRIHRREN
ncbi:DUF6716 putative glycosyltransferase [Vibrio alfacsensis]|uniref:DUF6716 putative glycosyltransferase n=1 Tax=Vibrio alfacsensis TaxID=1074311 RepID=UPI004068C429